MTSLSMMSAQTKLVRFSMLSTIVFILNLQMDNLFVASENSDQKQPAYEQQQLNSNPRLVHPTPASQLAAMYELAPRTLLAYLTLQRTLEAASNDRQMRALANANVDTTNDQSSSQEKKRSPSIGLYDTSVEMSPTKASNGETSDESRSNRQRDMFLAEILSSLEGISSNNVVEKQHSTDHHLTTSGASKVIENQPIDTRSMKQRNNAMRMLASFRDVTDSRGANGIHGREKIQSLIPPNMRESIEEVLGSKSWNQKGDRFMHFG